MLFCVVYRLVWCRPDCDTSLGCQVLLKMATPISYLGAPEERQLRVMDKKCSVIVRPNKLLHQALTCRSASVDRRAFLA